MEDENRPPWRRRTSRTTNHTELSFHAVLTEIGVEQLELARAQRALRARLENATDALTSVQNRKTTGDFAFSVLLNENGAGCFELTKA